MDRKNAPRMLLEQFFRWHYPKYECSAISEFLTDWNFYYIKFLNVRQIKIFPLPETIIQVKEIVSQ